MTRLQDTPTTSAEALATPNRYNLPTQEDVARVRTEHVRARRQMEEVRWQRDQAAADPFAD